MDRWGTLRASKLGGGQTWSTPDPHSHTLLSDGDGDAAVAFASMRAHGLDVACLTDHASGDKLAAQACGDCPSIGINEADWAQLTQLANETWSTTPTTASSRSAASSGSASVPETGHVNVWFTEDWTDPVATAHLDQRRGPAPGGDLAAQVGALERANPANFGALAGLYRWLQAEPGSPYRGGRGGLVGFNHPGREPGRFGGFAYDARIADRSWSPRGLQPRRGLPLRGARPGMRSPIAECLDKGWRVGLIGVTDEHGTDWGAPTARAAAAWVATFDRDGINDALQRRRFFATNQRGLRLDVEARELGSGASSRMGEELRVTSGPLELTVDLDANDVLDGGETTTYRNRTVNVQVCTPGDLVPTVVATRSLAVPGPDAPPLTFTVDVGDAAWVFLRITDPSQPEDGRAALPVASAFSGVGATIASASPFFLRRA